MRFSNLIIKGDINAMYLFDVQCTIGEPMRVNATIVPCKVGYALSEIRSCDLCPKDTYSHEGKACLPCPEGGNCSAVYELRDGNEWVKLGSIRDFETEVEVPFGERAPELPRVTRGVELPGTAPGYSLHVAPKYKRMFKRDYVEPSEGIDLYNYFNFSYCFWKQGVCPPGSAEYKTTNGNIECEALTNISGTRLYNCLIGKNFYHCPLDAVACPGIEFNGCLGEHSPKEKEAVAAKKNADTAPYKLIEENKECMGKELRVTDAKNPYECGKNCVKRIGCTHFTFGKPGSKLEGMCYLEDNTCESFQNTEGLDLYALNLLEEVYLVFKGEMNVTTTGVRGNATNATVEEDPYPQICNRTCNIGYTGIKCSRCKPHYFRTASQECQSCDVLSTDPEEAKALYGMIGFAGFIVFVIGLWFFLSTDPIGFLHSCLHGECCDSDEEIRIKAMKKEAEG